MNPLIQRATNSPSFLIALVIVCFASLQNAHAVSPPPGGAYPNFTTAEGQNALQELTTGAGNTAVGAYSMFSTTTTSFNTAVGAGALDLNTGDSNTAVGVAALLLNTGSQNTAAGTAALELNDAGGGNTAVGSSALTNNNAGSSNTAIGNDALLANTNGSNNTAEGVNALDHSVGGSANVALGFGAGENVTSASNVICIGASVPGANTSNTCFIGNIFGVTSSGGVNVLVNSNGKLGTVPSSQRFKDNIKPMEQASEVLYTLTPVTFRYKKEVDPTSASQFGLVAEDVEKVDPDLVVRDKEGKPYTVRYDAVNAMLLNEFLKEHKAFVQEQRKVQELEAKDAERQKEIKALIATVKEQASQIQKVSAQLELSKAVPQTVLNNQ
jgi:hypothetical protein